MKRIVLVIGLLAALLTAAFGQGGAQPPPAAGLMALTPPEMKWTQGGLALPGMEQMNLVGDPAKPGPYTVRLKFPAGYKLAAHTHPDSREVTVLSGTWYTGYGEKSDVATLKELPAGSFYTEPANVAHFVEVREPVMIQVSGTGPSGRKFVNPADKVSNNAQQSPPTSAQAKQIEAMVNKAAELVNNTGKAAFAEFRKSGSEWWSGNTYLFVYDLKSNVLLNPAFPKKEGTNTTGQKDANGKLYHHEFINVVQSKGSGWVDYMFPKPGQTEPSRKWSYVKAVNIDGTPGLIGAGFYPE